MPISRTQKQSASQSARQAVETTGLSLPTKPRSELPELPDDLTQVGDSALVELLARLGAWADFAGVQLAQAEVDEEELQRERDLAEAEGMIRGWETVAGGRASDASVTVAKARRVADPAVQAVRERELQVYARRKMLQSLYSSLERKSFIVSREITRRVGGSDKPRRSDRMRP